MVNVKGLATAPERGCMDMSFSAIKNCLNSDSYGMICVHCNACGRFNSDTILQDKLKMYQIKLEQEKNFDGWEEEAEAIQRRNVASNIKYFEDKIQNTEAEIASLKERT